MKSNSRVIFLGHCYLYFKVYHLLVTRVDNGLYKLYRIRGYYHFLLCMFDSFDKLFLVKCLLKPDLDLY
jgi:hypothetical protein